MKVNFFWISSPFAISVSYSNAHCFSVDCNYQNERYINGGEGNEEFKSKYVCSEIAHVGGRRISQTMIFSFSFFWFDEVEKAGCYLYCHQSLRGWNLADRREKTIGISRVGMSH
jgi:hypothetical protein